ncbi:hypothetical protein PSTG_08654 [Puccinia striiformis f. sp. tritici PST-78]|uniref:DNA 3'-5' helicase n=1 Tax=Puccinia striiformis f. sp. tritici PST-78 TaxID=1165861 RepID=A0A0L0VFG2_9BASI|nr:hypothetical protein PSTG_08654 [Puccinia striiformis f. sp. tritici PST-78]
MTRNNMPMLLMSATCRPVAIREIKKSLKLPDESLQMLRGELTRPEIRLIRITMDSSLSSCDDLLGLYAPKTATSDEKVVPTIIYSGSRHRTVKVLEVLDQARGGPDAAINSESTFARRFHSITGDLCKMDVAEEFGSGKFPIVSATMALGLGQNWSRVRSVIHMGRGDPAAICQMLGRCGRYGRPGVAIMFVEKQRVGGKNHIHQILDGVEQSDDDRMDGLAITPVCLRIAFSLDTKLGYIPMSFQSSSSSPSTSVFEKTFPSSPQQTPPTGIYNHVVPSYTNPPPPTTLSLIDLFHSSGPLLLEGSRKTYSLHLTAYRLAR